MQVTWVQSLLWEDPTCCGATKPMSHNYWAHALEPRSHNYWEHVLQLLKSSCPRVHAHQPEKPPQCEARALQLQSSPSFTLEDSPVKEKKKTGPSLTALWLKLCASTTGCKGSVPRKGIRFCKPHNWKKKKKRKKSIQTQIPINYGNDNDEDDDNNKSSIDKYRDIRE